MSLRRATRRLWLGLLSVACVQLLAAGCGQPGAKPGAVARPAHRALPGRWHRVLAGQSVVSVAARYGVPIEDVEEINGVDRRDLLKVGRLIFLPHAKRAQGATSRPVTSQPTKASPLAKKARFGWPVKGGKLSSRFGKRGQRVHEGVDIKAPAGTAVLAAESGEVIYAGNGIKGYGHMVILRHVGKLVTVYAHNQRNHVREGQRVRRGEVIAEVGRSGRATGYHLHFEVRIGERPVDPLPLLTPAP